MSGHRRSDPKLSFVGLPGRDVAGHTQELQDLPGLLVADDLCRGLKPEVPAILVPETER